MIGDRTDSPFTEIEMLEVCPHCKTNIFPMADRICPNCRGNLDGAPTQQRIPDGVIARVCPNCASSEHRKIKPDTLVAFEYNRICEKCGTLYVPPTPLWASILFVIIGLVFTLGAAWEMILHFNAAEPGLIFWKGVWLILGISVLLYGIRSRLQRSFN